MKQYGLASDPIVRWLIGSDGAVQDAIKLFLGEMAERDYVDVAGPPRMEDIARFAQRLAQAVPLPTVRLKMRMVVNATTDEAGVEVTCSDADLMEIKRWYRESTLAKLGKAS